MFERLVESESFDFDQLHLLGAGPVSPSRGSYTRLTGLTSPPSALGMSQYARFCGDFGRATTETVLELRPDVLLCHDISEGPDLMRLSRAGIKVVTVFHVDVVDIFTRLYLKDVVGPEPATRWYRKLRNLPWPGVLRLVFEKQQQVMELGSLSVVPSTGAHHLLERCYPESRVPVATVGWGAPSVRYTPSEIEEEAGRLRETHRIPGHHRVLLTLSRLSPEKAQHRLLQAVRFAEDRGRMPDDVTVVIAGAPAFMEGKRHAARLHRLARRLRTRVVFPGHVGGVEKAGWYRTASIFVVNSLHESYGLTTLEAMQQGCPVAAVRSFGTADTVNRKVGRLVPAGPSLPLRLWGTIELLLGSNLQKMGREAERKAQQATFEAAAARLAGLIRAVHNN